MKRIAVFSMVMVLALGLVFTTAEEPEAFSGEPLEEEEVEEFMADADFEDGTYRGTFSDRDEMHVGLQFTLEDNIITEIEHRHMAYDGIDYLENEDFAAIREQHEQAVEYLEGQDVREALVDLYEPGDFVEDIDTFSGATIYSQKEISAIVDGLNRGVYRFREVGGEVPEGYSPLPEDADFEDGTYRGTFSDRDEMHVGLQFTLEDNIITEIEHRHMAYDGIDYLENEDYAALREQHEQAIEHLEGEDVREVLTDLYEPGDFVDDIDTFSGATIYSQKELSAIMDGLNRGVYRFREVGGEVPEDYNPVPEDADFEDGTYRGTFSDRDEMHVGLQFTLEDNIITEIEHRHMAYAGIDYLENEDYAGIREQHEQAIEHLEGEDVREVLTDLYEPGDFVDDVDTFSGATIYSQKELSAIMDGLNRGVYRFREVGGEVPEDYNPLY